MPIVRWCVSKLFKLTDDQCFKSGAGGIRTLVQIWNKLCFLHAYPPLNCREGEGWRIACTVFRRCFISPGYHTLTRPVPLIDAPDADKTERNVSGTKAELILN